MSRVVLVTGGGRGFGRVLAEHFAAHGDRVGIIGRSAESLEETVAALHGRAALAAADVTDREAVATAISSIERELGPVDVLVNNAGISTAIGPLWETDPAEWWRIVEVNLRGTFNCSHAVLPAMVARGNGRIINVASHAGVHRWPYLSGYAVAKAAVVKLTENLALETRERGVKVFVMHPGTLEIGLTSAVFEEPASDDPLLVRVRAWFEEQRDAGTLVPADAAANLVEVLASGQADALSGRYVSVHDDVEALIAAAEEIRRRDLQVLKLDRYPEGP